MRKSTVLKARRRIVWLVSLLAAVGLFIGLQKPVNAHPHAWIDVRVKVLFDGKARITALAQEWTFDPIYTAFALDGLEDKKGQPPDQKKVEAVTRENLKNLDEYGYFTTVETKAGKAKFSGVRDIKSAVKKGRLQMSFTVVLDSPLDAATEPVVYAIYDPTFYIEILHAERGEAVALTNAADGCRHTLQKPNPNPETVALAAGLDRTQTAGDGLGEFFAEKVSIRCGAQP